MSDYFVKTLSEEQFTVTGKAMTAYALEENLDEYTNLGVLTDSVCEEDLSITADNRDHFIFTLENGGLCVISTSGSEYGDTCIRLYDNSGNLLGYDDDSGYNGYSRLNVALEAGTYEVVVSGYSNSTVIDNYQFNVDYFAVVADAYENNDSFAAAKEIKFTADEDGEYLYAELEDLNFHVAGDVDYYKFTLTETSKMYFDVNGNQGYPYVTLYDANKKEFERYGESNQILAAGTYYIKVEPGYGDMSVDIYSMYIEADPVRADIYDKNGSNNKKSTATVLTFDEDGVCEVDDLSLHTADDVDYFKFTVSADNAGRWLDLSISSDAGDDWGNEPIRWLFTDSNGNIVEKITPDAGDYYLKIYSDELINSYYIAVRANSVTDLGTLGSSVGSYLSDYITGDDGADYYKFTVSQDGLVEFGIIDDYSSRLDFSLYDENGNYFSMPYNTCSMILDAGDYYLKVYEYGYDYSINIKNPWIEEELGDLCEAENQCFTVNCEAYGSSSLLYYEFTLSEDGLVSIYDNSNYPWHVDFYILKKDGSTIRDDYYPTAGRLEAGTYYVVADISGEAYGNYQFQLNYQPGNPDAYEPNDSEENAAELGDLSTVKNKKLENLSLDYSGDNDYFTFTLSSAGYVTLKVDTLVAEDDYTQAGYYLWKAEDGVEGDYEYDEDAWWSEHIGWYDRFQINNRFYLDAGTYYVSIESMDGTVDKYTFTANYTTTANGDKYEANDTIATAKSIGSITNSKLNLRVEDLNLRVEDLNLHHVNDVDHYKFNLASDAYIWVQYAVDEYSWLELYSPQLYGGEGGFLNHEGSPIRHFEAGDITLGVCQGHSEIYTSQEGIKDYSLLIKVLEEEDRTISGTSNKDGIFTTGNVTLSSRAKLTASEFAAITVVDKNRFSEYEEYALDYEDETEEDVIAEPFSIVTLNGNTTVSCNVSNCLNNFLMDADGNGCVGGAIFFYGYGDYESYGRVVFNGSNITVSATGDEYSYAAAISSSGDLELDFSNSQNVNISVSGDGIGIAVFSGGNLNIKGDFNGKITADGDTSAGDGPTAIYANGDITVDGDIAGTVIAWGNNCDDACEYEECLLSADGIHVWGNITVDGEISGTVAAVQRCQQHVGEDDPYTSGIRTEYGFYGTISGTVFAGNVTDDSITMDSFLAKLADSGTVANKEFLKNSSEGFDAINVGSSTITFTETARIWGNVSVGANSSITLSSQAVINGDLGFGGDVYGYGEVINDLIVELDRIAASTTVNGYIYGENLTITIDANEARNGVYSISDNWNPENTAFAITYGEDTYTLEDAAATDSGYVFTFVNGMNITLADDEGLILTVSNSTYLEPDDEAPGKVTGVKVEIDKGDVNVSWNEATDNIGVVKYEYRYGKTSSLSGEGVFVTDTDFDHNNMEVGSYYCQVRAYDAKGNAGAWSDIVHFGVSDYTAPDMGKLSEVEVTDYSVALSWDAAQDDIGVVMYEISYGLNDAFDKTLKVNALTCTFNNLAIGEYSVKVRAYDAANNVSDWSNVESFEIEDVTKPVLNSSISAKVTGTSATITWGKATDNVGVTGYLLRYGKNSDLDNANIKELDNINSYELKGLDDVSTYYYQIAAVDAAGNVSNWSDVREFNTPDCTPPDLDMVSPKCIVKDNTATITWDDARDNVGVAGYTFKYTFEGVEKVIDVKTPSVELKNLANGEYQFIVGAYDAAGNRNWYVGKTFTIDYIAPDIYEDNDGIIDGTCYQLGNLAWGRSLTVKANLDVEEDVDCFSFYLSGDSKIDVDIKGAYYTIYNVDLAEIDTDKLVGNQPYFVKIEGPRTEEYTFSIRAVEWIKPTELKFEPITLQSVVTAEAVTTTVSLGDLGVFELENEFSSNSNDELEISSVSILKARGGFDYSVSASGKNSAEEDVLEELGSGTVAANENIGSSVLIEAESDGVFDLFFGEATGRWGSSYIARHVGTKDSNWSGTREEVNLSGKNKITDFFVGAENDGNILALTDDAWGDALFVDDVYSATPGSAYEQQSRIANLKEVLAGAGNDVVDMTSEKFEYVGGGVIVRGGDGNDTIWANKGNNKLFGDAGNDNIVGAAASDLIAGGLGDDILHGGGGDDVFAFGLEDGNDIIKQLDGGTVTLWFADDEANVTCAGNKYTYSGGTVTVEGDVEVKVVYGGADLEDDLTIFNEFKDQAFAGSTSDTIFKKDEQNTPGTLA